MIEKVARVAARYEELNRLMADPEASTHPVRIREYAQEQAESEAVYLGYQRYQQVEHELNDTRRMLDEEEDSDLIDLARAELESLEAEKEELLERLKRLLLPKDPNDDKNIIVEVR